jgi:tetratricopeptide (TPR) repeat protein
MSPSTPLKRKVQKGVLLVLLLVGLPLCLSSGLECWRYHQASLLREQADDLEHQGRHVEALADYQRCLELYPYFLDIHQEMAEIYMDKKDWGNALLCLDKAVRDCPTEPKGKAIVYRQRGQCELKAGRVIEARQDFLTAVRLDPDEDLARQLLERSDFRQATPVPQPIRVD